MKTGPNSPLPWYVTDMGSRDVKTGTYGITNNKTGKWWNEDPNFVHQNPEFAETGYIEPTIFSDKQIAIEKMQELNEKVTSSQTTELFEIQLTDKPLEHRRIVEVRRSE